MYVDMDVDINVDMYVHFQKMESYSSKNIRKITKSGSGSCYVIIPKPMLTSLRWKERQKVQFQKKGKSIIIKDWKK